MISLNWFFDQVQKELGQEFKAKDPLRFVDSKAYPDRMSEAQKKTGETEAIVVMQGTLKGIPMIATALNLILWAVQWALWLVTVLFKRLNVLIKSKTTLSCFAASGGARMQEGVLSLMQMARTSDCHPKNERC